MTEQEKPEGAEEKAEAAPEKSEEKTEAAPEKSEEKAEAAPEKSEEKAEEKTEAAPEKSEEKAEAAPEKSEEKAEEKAEDKKAEAAEEKAAPEKKAEAPVAKDKKAKGKKKKVEEAAKQPAAAKTPVPAAAREEKHDEEARPEPTPIAGEPFGLMGVFKTPAEIYHACEELRDAGYVHFDAHTPFPVHGLEKAMALPPSKLPWLVLCGGATGLLSAVLLAYYTQGVWYSHIISGKEPFSYQAFVPIFFELTVLFSALTCFVSVWALPKLPTFFHPTMTHPAFPRATDDAFLISVEARDPKYDAAKTRRLLEKLGAQEIQEIAQ